MIREIILKYPKHKQTRNSTKIIKIYKISKMKSIRIPKLKYLSYLMSDNDQKVAINDERTVMVKTVLSRLFHVFSHKSKTLH